VAERLERVVGPRLGRERSRRLLAAGGAIAGVALIIGVIVGATAPGSSKGASTVKISGAATVQRRDLVSTDTESGTLGYANPQTVYNRVGGTVTWLPKVGQQIKPGGTLYRVDNAPIVLFDGTTPAYRTLQAGISDGPDIGELNQNLVALGYDPSHEITVNDTWQTGTTDAVNRWQSALGQTQTGAITLGQVVFLPGPQLVTTVETVLGSTGGSAGSGSGSSGSGSGSGSGSATGASYTSAGSHTQFVSLTSATRTGPTGPTGPSGANGRSGSNGASGPGLKALIALLRAETAELRARGGSASGGSAGSLSAGGASRGGGSSSGGGGGSAGGSGGGTGAGAGSTGSSGGGTATPILQTTSIQEVVTVQLDATKQTEAVLGEPVTVQLPDGSTVNGKITQVSPVAQSSSSSSGSGGSGSGSGSGGSGSGSPSATIPVTITLSGHSHVSGLDQAAVSVNFAQQKASGVLSVPVTALIATQGGGYAVQEAAAPHTLIPVTPGLFAAGYVQISGSGVYPGLEVTDSQG
jgi:Putative peptidoglycan binding domain